MTAAGWPELLVALLLGYGFGSIPFGILLTRAAGLGDVRKIGSGNIGATNVLRTGHKGLAAATLLADMGKGAAAVLLARAFWPAAAGADPALVAGAGAMLGHVFPLWLRFRGGKGVATALGVYIAVAWPAGLLACVTWLLVALLFRYSSLAALIAVTATPAYMLVFGGPPAVVLAALVGALVWLRHGANVRRLIAGTEPKIGQGERTPG
ncbi:MAG: glycerol-3-phosphate 1-O-acyltransferase PlsY [Alphaproteobacteria bacterium]|nr:glycerol-3-phosphate 1-O-acyltransferase PlsY [Alphaproteobacteria bacterium]